jgi:hypothetical protein
MDAALLPGIREPDADDRAERQRQRIVRLLAPRDARRRLALHVWLVEHEHELPSRALDALVWRLTH